MSEFNFEHLRPYSRARSESLQTIIARNIGPRVGENLGPVAGRLRSARFSLGESVERDRTGGGPPPPPAPPDDTLTPPPGSVANPLQVASSYYGGRVLVYNFLGATGGGGGNNEIRVSPYLDYEHLETKALWIVPYAGVTPGQYLQVLKSTDDDVANSATPTGSIIGADMGRTGVYPSPDNTRAIPVPVGQTLLDTFRLGWSGGAYIKIRLFFVAPAIALPQLSVMLSITYKEHAGAYLFAVRS